MIRAAGRSRDALTGRSAASGRRAMLGRSAASGRPAPIPRAAAATAAASLFGLAALHAAWGAGSAWPLPDRDALADAVIGAAQVPPPAACFAVSGALTAAGTLVAGWPRGRPAIRQAGVSGVVVVLAGRGVLGLAGRTQLVSRSSVSERFTRLDRRIYSPLCLALACLSALSALPHPSA
jgi:Protein of unknown function (DUF3995)